MSNLRLVLVLLLMTLGHAGVRHLMADTSDSRPKLVSSLEAGAPILGLQELELAGEVTSEGSTPAGIDCMLLVVFDPTCSQCWKSAQLRSEAGHGAVPAIWLSSGRKADAPEFERSIPPRDHVLWDHRTSEILQVNAVPAAFLVRPDRTLARVWPFSGRERDEDLQEWCAGSGTPRSDLHPFGKRGLQETENNGSSLPQ